MKWEDGNELDKKCCICTIEAADFSNTTTSVDIYEFILQFRINKFSELGLPEDCTTQNKPIFHAPLY
jgi:hypothetical protein